MEAVTPEGLKSVYKDFNRSGEDLVRHLQRFREHGVYVLGSFIFGLPSDREQTFDATLQLAQRSGLAFAQFLMLTPFPGTVDFDRWEKAQGEGVQKIAGIPLTRYWLIPPEIRPKMFMPHPTMSSDEMRARTLNVWSRFYSFGAIWERSACATSFKARLILIFISKLYRQMYANTGMAIDSARATRSAQWARWLAKPCRWLFSAKPMPELSRQNP